MGLVRDLHVLQGSKQGSSQVGVVTAALQFGNDLNLPRDMLQAVKLRLDAEVIAHFKSGGDGWQTRINDVLLRTTRREKAKRA